MYGLTAFVEKIRLHSDSRFYITSARILGEEARSSLVDMELLERSRLNSAM